MSFAGRAHELVARQSGGTAGAQSSFSTLAIIGISLGGAAFLVLVLVGVMHFWYLRQRRPLIHERSITVDNHRNSNVSRPHVLMSPQAAARYRLQMRNAETAGWGATPSQEDLQEQEVAIARRRTEKRTSELLSWPLPGKGASKNSKKMKKIRNSQLAVIPESPMDSSRNGKTRIMIDDDNGDELLPAELEAITPPEILKAQGRVPHSAFSADKLDTSQASAVRNISLLSRMQYGSIQSALVRPYSDRSASDPAIWTYGVYGDPCGSMSASMNQAGRMRSFSTSNNRPAPTAPLPPLPKMGIHQESAEVLASARPASYASATSLESMGTSILNSPDTKAGVEFSQEHREVNIEFQSRQNEPNDKSALMSGPKHSRVRSKITNSPRLNSSVGSLRITSARNSMELKRLSIGENSKKALDKQISSGSLRTAQAIVISRPSSQSSQVEIPKDVVATPKRDQHTRKLSDALGSPLQRRRSSGLKSTVAKGPMPPREISQTSIVTTSSASPGNPFQWDSPGPPSKRGSVKGSPISKKTHRRQPSVRTTVGLLHLGPPSRSTSSSKMGQIVEESMGSSEMQHAKPYQPMSRPPTSATFAPQLKYPSHYRASLATESPPLSLLQYEQDCDNGEFLFKEHVKANSSYTTGSTLPESNSSSAIISAFPVPSSRDLSDSTAGEHFTSSGESFGAEPAGISQFFPSPRQYIPGLSLVAQNDSSVQNLQYPTIELLDSPEPYDAKFEEDSLNIPCPSSPRPAHAELPMSPPLPRNLSPPLKSNATTQVTSPPMPIQPQRITPLSSSVNPFNTKPNFPLPTKSGTEEHQRQPNGSRIIPAMNVYETAKALRTKTNSAFEMSNEDFTNLGLGGSQSEITLRGGMVPYHAMFYEEKENDKGKRGGIVLDEIDPFWSSSVAGEDRSRVLLETPVSRTKKVAWGGVDVRETNPTIGSDSRASFREDDFF